MTECGILGEG